MDVRLPFILTLEFDEPDNVKQYCQTEFGLAVVNGVGLSDDDKQAYHLIEISNGIDVDITYGVILFKGKCVSKPLNGSGHTTMTDPTWALAGSHPL